MNFIIKHKDAEIIVYEDYITMTTESSEDKYTWDRHYLDLIKDDNGFIDMSKLMINIELIYDVYYEESK